MKKIILLIIACWICFKWCSSNETESSSASQTTNQTIQYVGSYYLNQREHTYIGNVINGTSYHECRFVFLEDGRVLYYWNTENPNIQPKVVGHIAQLTDRVVLVEFDKMSNIELGNLSTSCNGNGIGFRNNKRYVFDRAENIVMEVDMYNNRDVTHSKSYVDFRYSSNI